MSDPVEPAATEKSQNWRSRFPFWHLEKNSLAKSASESLALRRHLTLHPGRDKQVRSCLRFSFYQNSTRIAPPYPRPRYLFHSHPVMPGGQENSLCTRGPRCKSRSPRKAGRSGRVALKSLSLDMDRSINTPFELDWPPHDLGHEGVFVGAKNDRGYRAEPEDYEDKDEVSRRQLVVVSDRRAEADLVPLRKSSHC